MTKAKTKHLYRQLSLLLLFFISGFAHSQYRVLYKATYRPIKGEGKTQTEYMALDIKQDKSIYYSWSAQQLDSLQLAQDYGAIGKAINPYLKQIIYKDSKKNRLTVTEKLNDYLFTFPQNIVLQWKLKPESGRYLQYKTQAASANFGGRSWKANFAPELTFSNGPYKFGDLPGLIVSLESEDKDYLFEMISIVKIKNLTVSETRNTKKWTEKEAIAFKRKFRESPSDYPLNLKNKYNDRFEYQPAESNPKQKQETEQFVRNLLKQFDNPIELGDICLVF